MVSMCKQRHKQDGASMDSKEGGDGWNVFRRKFVVHVTIVYN